MTITIYSPPGLTAYFASPACHNSVWAAFDSQVILGWHPDKTEAQKLFCGLPIVKIYKDLKG